MNYKKLSIILLLGGYVISTYGQEFGIVEFVEKPTDESAQMKSKRSIFRVEKPI
jgi:hypothetical protein